MCIRDSSLGVPELPEDKAEELRRFLTPFSALSVREKRGQVLLREAAGRDARVVLDPTLLLLSLIHICCASSLRSASG